MSGNEQIVLRVTPELKAKIQEVANARDVSLQTIILERLAKSFRTKATSPKPGWVAGKKRKSE